MKEEIAIEGFNWEPNQNNILGFTADVIAGRVVADGPRR